MWANQVQRVGAAAKPLSFWKAKPTHVAARIRQTLELEGLRQHARTLGAAMARLEWGDAHTPYRALLRSFP